MCFGDYYFSEVNRSIVSMILKYAQKQVIKMKHQIKYKILAAAYKEIKRSADQHYPNEGTNPFSYFDAGVMSHLMAFIDKKQTGIFLGSSFSVHEIVMAGKVVTNRICFPEKLPEDFRDLRLRENVGSLGCSTKLVTEEGLWESDAIINYIKLSAFDDNEKKNMLIKEAFEYAARTGHIDLLNDLKEVFELTADKARADGNFALRLAAENGHVNVLRFLKEVFELTADDARDDENYALGLAAENGYVEVLRFLKEWGLTADDAKDDHNYTLGSAAANGRVEVLRFFKEEWELTAEDIRVEYNLALRAAAENGHVEVLRLLKEEWELTAEDARDHDNYAFVWAAKNGHVEVLRVLKEVFELTADDARDDENYVLRHAAKNGHVEVLRFLKDEWELTAEDASAYDNWALRYAAANGHVEALKVLIEYYMFPLTQEISDELIRLAYQTPHIWVIDYLNTVTIPPPGKRQKTNVQN